MQTELFGGLIGLSALTYIGYQLKAVPKMIWDWFLKKTLFRVTIEQTDDLYIYMERWLLKNHKKKYRNVEATINSKFGNEDDIHSGKVTEKDSRIKAEDEIKYWQYDDTFVIRYKGKRLVINKGREKLEAAKNIRNVYINRFSIGGILAKKYISQLLKEVIKYNQQFKEENPPSINISDGMGYWNHIGKLRGKSFKNIFLKEKESLIQDIDSFEEMEKWYTTRGIAYKRGYLFYGKPGNGKTATCMAVAAHTKRDIYYLSLADIDDDKYLSRQFGNIQAGSLLILEDIDAAFVKRDSDKTGVSMSALLNCLDGLLSKHNIITIMTTNHPENLDPALIRTGRIDFKLEISNPATEIVEEYIRCFYDDSSISLDHYESESKSMAEIQELCMKYKDNKEILVSKLNNVKIKESC